MNKPPSIKGSSKRSPARGDSDLLQKFLWRKFLNDPGRQVFFL